MRYSIIIILITCSISLLSQERDSAVVFTIVPKDVIQNPQSDAYGPEMLRDGRYWFPGFVDLTTAEINYSRYKESAIEMRMDFYVGGLTFGWRGNWIPWNNQNEVRTFSFGLSTGIAFFNGFSTDSKWVATANVGYALQGDHAVAGDQKEIKTSGLLVPGVSFKSNFWRQTGLSLNVDFPHNFNTGKMSGAQVSAGIVIFR